jgi:hypothetical protein
VDVTTSREASEAGGHALDRAERARIWLAFVVPPFAFLLGLTAYGIVPYVCDAGNAVALHAWMLISLLVDVGAGVLGWREWVRMGRGHPDDLHGEIPGGRLLSMLGMVGSGFFALLIVGQWIAIGLVPNCIR